MNQMEQKKNNNIRYLYEHLELDYDGRYYFFKNRDVVLYDNSDEKINRVIKYWKCCLEQRLYIIGNYIYFTLYGTKYWLSLTDSSEEWVYIDNVIKDFESNGAVDVVYNQGRLD